MGFPSSDPCNHKVTNKCNARVFYGGGGPCLPVGRGVEGEERRQSERGKHEGRAPESTTFKA